MTFQDKVVLITGGSSGIGLATARALAERGAHVWIIARGEERLAAALAQVRAACRSSAQKCGSVSADVSDAAQVETVVARVIDSAGVPDLLVNSAGIVHPGYFQELAPEAFRQQIEVNYLGTVYMTRAVVPGMIARGSGHVVNVVSAGALLGVYGYTGYCGSKFAVRGFSDVLRVELKPLGVGVSVVFPPDTDTSMLAGEMPLRPQETRLVFGDTLLSADTVASAILKGVARGPYVITPGLETTLLYGLVSALGTLQYPIMDILVARAQRKLRASGDAQEERQTAMSGDLRVEPIADKRGLTEFIKFPFKLYRGDPNWVPPLIEERLDLFNPKKNPFWEHSRYQLFLARRDGELVGTIAAVVNDNHNTTHNEKMGSFGFLETINDPAVAAALLDAAEAWVKAQGMTIIRGPLNPSTNDEVGTLIDGFDEPPMVMMTYNPRYIPALIEGCGYTKAMDLFAWIYDIEEDLKNAPEKLARVAEKAMQKQGIRVRKVDMAPLRSRSRSRQKSVQRRVAAQLGLRADDRT